MENTKPTKAVWAGRIISILCILFMLMDGGMKVFKAAVSVEGSAQLGWPVEHVPAIGLLLVICTLLYAIPRTSVLGAILVTAYLGGATSIMVRSGTPYYFPVVLGVLVWAGLFLQNQKLRTLLPLVKD